MSRSKSSSSAAPTMDPGTAAPTGRAQFSIPDLLQLYRQTLYMACKEADLSAAGNPFGEDGLAAIRSDLDNWNNVEFDPPGCLRLSKKSGACQKIVSYWKKLLGSILTDRDPSSFGNHDRGVMTICKLLHKDFQVAVLAITKWNERDFPNIPTDQVKEKLSMNQLTFLCRRYHNDLTLIAHAFKSSIANNDFKYLNPRSTETYPIDNAEYESKEEDNAHDTPPKQEKRKRPFNGDDEGMGVGANDTYDMSPKLAQLPSRLPEKNFPTFANPLTGNSLAFPPSQNRIPYEHDASILKSLLPKADGNRGHEAQFSAPLDLDRHPQKSPKLNGTQTAQYANQQASQPSRVRTEGREDPNAEIQRLRNKNKKYVGIIMNLVEQLVQVGQIPFVDLRSIEQEDRDQQQSNTIIAPEPPIAASRNPEQSVPRRNSSSSTTSVYINGHTQKRDVQPSPVNYSDPRRKVPKPMPQVTFDRTTMRWSDSASGQDSNHGAVAQRNAYPATVIRVPPVVNGAVRSTLSSLLESPSGSPVIDAKTEHHSQMNGHGVKSKRKNNPVKRELPGYAPRSVASPDASGTSDDTASVASTDLNKNVRANLFVPPVETTYVDNRGGATQEGTKMDHRNENGASKKKCNLQSLTDSLMFANSGLTSMAAAATVDGNDGQTTARIVPGSVVFGRARDGCLYPAEVVEKLENSFVVAWMHANSSASLRAEDVFSLEEVLKPYQEIRYRNEDEVHRAVFVDRNRNHSCSILNLFGHQKRCHLADIFVPDEKYEDYDDHGQREYLNEALESHEAAALQNLSANLFPRTVTRGSRTAYFRGCCFILTSQKNSLFKGYDDDQIIGLIQALGGSVVKKFEDLVAGEEKYLVAPCTCGTPKFFQCLAANIPCVSYQWIIDCHNDRSKLDISPYILPAGMDGEQVVLWNPRTFMFGDQRIGLYEAASKLCETWFLALKSGNVDVHVVDPDSAVKDLQSVEVLVVERSCSQALRDAAAGSGVHVVNENWLKKSLVHGKMQLWNNPEFAPEIE
ncbi:uncharacterized protein LOC129583663 isoform X2 [Paramacrobiotus metropolitanus]|uniref:uncharacterized protein LOC129583663 isoform X2 n=1 Tax=Paramacrobiotus metropolitanus TaxID=2943436 RepID=UPI002445A797|nr:uncharacterized protein LOC129583663 isoform X2 [Paramacrobiotus metropolitanus]